MRIVLIVLWGLCCWARAAIYGCAVGGVLLWLCSWGCAAEVVLLWLCRCHCAVRAGLMLGQSRARDVWQEGQGRAGKQRERER